MEDNDNINLEKFQKQLAQEFEKEIRMLLYSEWSWLQMRKEIELKPVEIEPEYQQDCTYYMNKFWWNMPYPKGTFLGIFNITS